MQISKSCQCTKKGKFILWGSVPGGQDLLRLPRCKSSSTEWQIDSLYFLGHIFVDYFSEVIACSCCGDQFSFFGFDNIQPSRSHQEARKPRSQTLPGSKCCGDNLWFIWRRRRIRGT